MRDLELERVLKVTSKLFGLSRQVRLDDRACGQGGECNPDAVIGKPGKRGLDWVGAA